jgi:hypothetical protein
MGFFDNIKFGDVFGAGSVADLIKTAVNAAFPDKTEVEKDELAAKLQATQISAALATAQIAVNQAEAANPNLFVSGWRPAAGWTCVTIFAWSKAVGPTIGWVAAMAGSKVPFPLSVDGDTTSLLMALLGIGWVSRSYEKTKGVASS